jgi:hypothetical protein
MMHRLYLAHYFPEQDSVEIPAVSWAVAEGKIAIALVCLVNSHLAREMNIFDVNSDLIEPEVCETHLWGAVIMRFSMEHFFARCEL